MDEFVLDEFTEEEKKILSQFVTNLDKSVFALKNLPEVVKGALFSRYSRSTKSVRRVLLDEFIKRPEIGFKEIVAMQTGKDMSDIVASKKAEEFYDRVLVQFGDDSVAELAGTHLACENVSIIATKVLEDARIGLSPLEKSTRYVYFDQKVNGKYRYYREPVIMNSEFAALYEKTCDMLFDAYSQMIEPMKKFVMDNFPKDATVTDRAYEATVRAKTCDILRALLPASTLTNVGIFGNGRAFEYLLTKMYAHQLQEINDLAGSMQTELAKIIPSFVKRANDEEFGKMTQKFLLDTERGMESLVGKILETKAISQSKPSKYVTLVDYDPEAEVKAVAAAMFNFCNMPLNELIEVARKMTTEERKVVIKEYLYRRENRRHKPGRAFENIYYTFEFLGNYGVYRDLHRHRILTQVRQLLSTEHGFEIPEEIIAAGFEDKWIECMQRAKEAYEEISKRYPQEAQYVVPLAYKIRWYIVMNLREIFHFVELRTTPYGHHYYRKIAQDIFQAVKQVHPNLVEWMKFVDMQSYAMGRLGAEKAFDKKIEDVKKRYGIEWKEE
jgi:thymidylate synthase ThyX